MANSFYASAMKHIGKGEVVWLASGGSTIKVDLLSSTYTPNINTDEFHSTLTSSGAILGTATMTLIDATTDGVCDASDTSVTASGTGTVAYIVIWKSTGTDSTSPLLLILDTATGLPLSVTSSSSYTVTWDNGTNKVMKI